MGIYDIAQRSGVSIATVPRAVNGSSNVSAATRKEVIAVIEQEDYIPNAFTRGLNLNSMKIVGILCTDIANTFYAKTISLVEGLLYRNGFDILLCYTGNDPENKKEYPELFLAKRVDAVILIGSALRENVDNSHIENAAKQIPVVIINGLVELPGTYCVTCDEWSAVTQNAALLNRQEHRDILYLYDILTYSGCSKLNGYRVGTKQRGLPVNENLVVQVPKSTGEVKRHVPSLPESGVFFNAVMVLEDLLVVGAMKTLQESGRSAPVIGLDSSVLSECCSSSLASADNTLDVLYPATTSMLTGILEGKSVPQKMVISTTLVQWDTSHTDLQ